METEVWLSELINNSGRELRERNLEITKIGVARLGARLSDLFVDFLFVVSDGDDELLEKIFESLRAALEPRIAGGLSSLVVVDRIFALVEKGEKELRDRMKFKKLKDKQEEEELVQAKMINRFCEEIMILEGILSAVMTMPVQAHVLINDFRLCQERLDAIYVAIYASSSRLEDKMYKKVQQLWTEFELDQ